MRKVLITGETGYISCRLRDRLNAEGFEAECLSLRGGLPADLSGYDAVVHCAAIVHRRGCTSAEYYRVNTELTRRLALAYRRAGGGLFVFISTMAVFGTDGSLRRREVIGKASPTRARGGYGKSKLLAERALRELEDDILRVAVVRPPLVYGKGCPGNFNMLRWFSRYSPVFPYVNNKRSMLHIDRLCGIICAIVNEGWRGTFHPQDSRYYCTSEVVHRLAGLQGRNISMSRRLGRLVCLVDISLIRKAFGSLIYERDLSRDCTGGLYERDSQFED